MKSRDCSICGYTALAVAISAFGLIALFWALVLMAVVAERPEKIPEHWIFAIKDNYFMIGGAVLGTISTVLLTIYEYRKKIREDRLVARSALLAALRFNDDRATQMLGQFAQGAIPNYQFDTTGLIIWLSRSSDLFEKDVLEKINWHRYQLDHLNTQLTTFYVFARCCGERVDQQAIFDEDRGHIVKHLGVVTKDIHSLLTSL